MPRKSRVLNGRNALKAGQLGERAVRDVLALSEPDVEVKTMQLERHTFSVELTQLERQPDKVYVVCAYSRGINYSKGGRGKEKKTWQYTIEQAFKQSLTFVLVSTDKLLELVKAGSFKVRWVEKNYRTKARFVALFRLEDCLFQGGLYQHTDGVFHEVYNAPELIKALYQERDSGRAALQDYDLQETARGVINGN